jgi:peptidoglycan/LPS O-acetylase OafA/YrhL
MRAVAKFLVESARGNIDLTSINHERAAPSRNNFTALRFIAATLVILSHGVELPTGLAQRDWVYTATGKALSWYAVNLFFVISGYLIFLSWERTPSIKSFFWARFLRIMPGLFAMLVITVVILGTAFSTLAVGDFITNTATFKYFVGCLSVLFVQYELPRVFSSNPIHAVNGSLWTLRYEISCYFAVGAAGAIGALGSPHRRRTILLIGTLVASTMLISLDALGLGDSNDRLGMIYEFARLSMCFQLGGLYSEFGDKIPLRSIFVVGLVALLLLIVHTSIFTPVASITTAYVACWFAFIPNGKWITWTRWAPDYSYGIYIYAFPVQQAFISLMPGSSPSSNIIVGFCVTLFFAGISWHIVEKPALSLKRYIPRFSKSKDESLMCR